MKKLILFLCLVIVLLIGCKKLQNEGLIDSKVIDSAQYIADTTAISQSIGDYVKVDSSKVKSLKKYFRIKKDEYSNDNVIFYEPKSAPLYINNNGFYCSFTTENGTPSNFKLNLQYYDEDWLFIRGVKLLIDGKAFEILPYKVDRDNGDGGMIWEWFSVPITASNKDLIDAICKGKKMKMKLIGSQYYDTKVITEKQALNIKRAVELYTAMGGKFY